MGLVRVAWGYLLMSWVCFGAKGFVVGGDCVGSYWVTRVTGVGEGSETPVEHPRWSWVT